MVYPAAASCETERRSSLRQETCGDLGRNINKVTYGQVRQLQVTCPEGTIVLRGICRSYYSKQLATKAVLDTQLKLPVRNEITVQPSGA